MRAPKQCPEERADQYRTPFGLRRVSTGFGLSGVGCCRRPRRLGGSYLTVPRLGGSRTWLRAGDHEDMPSLDHDLAT
jgi:hypothetical protein